MADTRPPIKDPNLADAEPLHYTDSAMQTPYAITALFLVLLLGVSAALYYPQYHAQVVQREQLTALLAGADNAASLDARTKTQGCAVMGPLPDHACTPGAVFVDATLDKICVSGYTTTVRNVSAKTHVAVFTEYGISYPQPHGTYEVDHLIPLAIGGSNDISNLFPEAADPKPGFKEKDLVEVYLREEVCAGRASLGAAQKLIANDWISIYEKLSPDIITRLRAQYRSWSN